MTDATITLLLDAINGVGDRAEASCMRIETRMDDGFRSVHGRVDVIAEGLAGLTAEHNRLAPFHRASVRPTNGCSATPVPTDGAPSARDWAGVVRVAAWVATGLAGTGLGALVMKMME